MLSSVIRSPIVNPLDAGNWFRGGSSYPSNAFLHFDANLDPYTEQTGGPHTFNHSILSPQYQLQSDGSSIDVGAKVAADFYGGERWVRSCGAVTNAVTSGAAVIGGPCWVVGAGVTIGAPDGDFYPVTMTSTSGKLVTCAFSGMAAGKTVVFGCSVRAKVNTQITIRPTSNSSDNQVVNLTAGEEREIRLSIVTAGSSGAFAFFDSTSTLGYNFDIARPFVVLDTNIGGLPYVPPGVTQPASNATTTNGMWFSLPDGSPLWKALDGYVDGVELVTNGGFDSDLAGWVKDTVGDGAFIWDAGYGGSARVTRTATDVAWTYTTINVVAGEIYELSARCLAAGMEGGTVGVDIRVGTAPRSNNIMLEQRIPYGSSGKYRFKPASSGVAYISVNGTNQTFAIFDNVQCQRIQPQPLTLATRVRMGVGSGDLPDNSIATTIAVSTSPNDTTYIRKDSGGNPFPIVANDGTSAPRPFPPSTAWGRGAIIRKVLQVNTAVTQMRVGYMIEGTHTAIQWSAWTAYDGSFNPSTLYRLMLGYNNPYPMGFNKITAWPLQVSDAELLEAWA